MNPATLGNYQGHGLAQSQLQNGRREITGIFRASNIAEAMLLSQQEQAIYSGTLIENGNSNQSSFTVHIGWCNNCDVEFHA